MNSAFDVVVVGGGNAALCAVVGAAQAGGRVAVLEAASEGESGGNSWFSDGAFRVGFGEFGRLRGILSGVSDAEAEGSDVADYSGGDFLGDLVRASGGRTDRGLARVLAEGSFPALQWMRGNGVRFELARDNQSWTDNGRRKYFGNLVARSVGKGVGLVGALRERARELGAEFFFESPARKLVLENGAVAGVVFGEGNSGGNSEDSGDSDDSGASETLRARAVVLACGGFEANADLRAEHLGPEWRRAVVRGTRENTGGGLAMAIAAGAATAGQWGGCHAVATDANSPPFGDFGKPGDVWKKHSYPYGLVVNRDGVRFVDEGADIRNHTYAKYGREVLRQPGGAAWQVFDAQVEPLLRSEYRHSDAAKVCADSVSELAEKMNAPQLPTTVAEFNRAVCDGVFAPHRLDGKRASGLAVGKSNWALRLERPPFLAFPVVCGITFTFGGLRTDVRGRVLRADGSAIPGLFAAGEMVGGVFYDNYPGGAGLSLGAVFGKRAGEGAVKL